MVKIDAFMSYTPSQGRVSLRVACSKQLNDMQDGSIMQQTMCCLPAAYPDATPTGNRRSINGSWNPFSSGPRNCIGQALAMAELRTVLAVFLGNFFFQLPEGVEREKFVEEEEVAWVTLQARHGVRLRVSSIMGMQKKEYGLTPEE